MRSLKIAVTVDPMLPVPPVEYGGIERVVEFVVNGLVERGHAVTLYAHPESHCKAKLVPYGVPPHFSKSARIQELWQIGSKLSRELRHLDAILSWGRLAALLPVLPNRKVVKSATLLPRWSSLAKRANCCRAGWFFDCLCRCIAQRVSPQAAE